MSHDPRPACGSPNPRHRTQKLAEFEPHLFDAGQKLAESGRSCPNVGRCWAILIRVGPKLTEAGPELVDSGQMVAEFGRNPPTAGRVLALLAGSGPHPADLGPKLVDSGHCSADVGRSCWSIMGNVGRDRANLGRNGVKCGWLRGVAGRIHSSLRRSWPRSGQFGPNSAKSDRLRPTVARNWPGPDMFGQIRPHVARCMEKHVSHMPES